MNDFALPDISTHQSNLEDYGTALIITQKLKARSIQRKWIVSRIVVELKSRIAGQWLVVNRFDEIRVITKRHRWKNNQCAKQQSKFNLCWHCSCFIRVHPSLTVRFTKTIFAHFCSVCKKYYRKIIF